MLDGIDPEGLGILNNVAGMALGTAIVFGAFAATLGVYLWLGGKFGKFSGDKAAKGLNAMWLACLGVTFVCSVSGAIAWGAETGGTDRLMPEAARPQQITVNREAPVSTCNRNTGVRNFELEDDVLNHDDRMEIFEAVAAGAEGTGIGGQNYEEAVRTLNGGGGNYRTFEKLVWTPQQTVGQDGCNGQNLTVAPGTEVTVTYQEPTPRTDHGATDARRIKLKVPEENAE